MGWLFPVMEEVEGDVVAVVDYFEPYLDRLLKETHPESRTENTKTALAKRKQ